MAKKYLKEFYWKDYFMITLGLLLYCFGLMGFIKPVAIPTGALTGIGLLFDYATEGRIAVEDVLLGVNAVLLIIAFKFVGSKFMVKTIFGVFFLSLFIKMFKYIIVEPLIPDETLVSGVIGGMLCGAGLGVIFSANGSTGGTDIIIAIINKYKNISFGRGMLLCDFIIISCSYFVFKDITTIVYGLVVMGVMTYTIDVVINGSRQSVQIMIISKHHDKISDAINRELKRGCTLLDGMGWYSKTPMKVVMVMAKRTESMEIARLAKTVDDAAFVTITPVRSVYGGGFDQIHKADMEKKARAKAKLEAEQTS